MNDVVNRIGERAAFTDVPVSSLEAILLIVLLTGILLIAGYSLRIGVPPMSSSRAAREAVIALLPETIDGPIVDLGSGWGALTEALADRFPNNQVIGYELSPIPWAVSRLRLLIRRRPNLTYRRRDFLRVDLSHARAVTCYLMIDAMKPLAGKLRTELKPGAVIVCNAFALRGWEPERALPVAAAGGAMFYRYRVTDRGPAQ